MVAAERTWAEAVDNGAVPLVVARVAVPLEVAGVVADPSIRTVPDALVVEPLVTGSGPRVLVVKERAPDALAPNDPALDGTAVAPAP